MNAAHGSGKIHAAMGDGVIVVSRDIDKLDQSPTSVLFSQKSSLHADRGDSRRRKAA